LQEWYRHAACFKERGLDRPRRDARDSWAFSSERDIKVNRFYRFLMIVVVGAYVGGARPAQAAVITAIEYNVDGAGWVPLAAAFAPSVGPVSGSLGGVFSLSNMSSVSFTPAELLSSNLLLTNTTTATHEVKIVVATTDFSDPSGSVNIKSTVGGTAINSAAGSAVTFQSFVDPGNRSDHTGEAGAFTPGIQLTNFPTGSIAMGTASPLAGPYSLIQQYDITLVGGDHVQFEGDTALAAPEPASIALLGFGAAGMVGYGWKRRKFTA
jgi:hypothetical protein